MEHKHLSSRGFFGKWFDFYFRPRTMWEDFLDEPAERSLAAILPLWLIVIFAGYFGTSLVLGQATQFFYLSEGFSLFTYVFLIGLSVIIFHGSLVLFRGEGSLAQTASVMGYTAVFTSVPSFLFSALALLGLIGERMDIFYAPWVIFAIIGGLCSMAIRLWGFVSLLIGLDTAHQNGIGWIILAVVLGTLVTLLSYAAVFAAPYVLIQASRMF